MTAVYIHGIKNCDAMKKTFAWFERNGIECGFHDYKKSGIDDALIERAIKIHGWDNVINRRGTSWRKLPESVKTVMDENSALRAAHENPSLIKRPLVVIADEIILGYDPDEWRKTLV